MIRITLNDESSGFIRDLDFLADAGKFYKFIAVGDSVEKTEGSLEVAVKRNGKLFIIPLQPTCE